MFLADIARSNVPFFGSQPPGSGGWPREATDQKSYRPRRARDFSLFQLGSCMLMFFARQTGTPNLLVVQLGAYIFFGGQTGTPKNLGPQPSGSVGFLVALGCPHRLKTPGRGSIWRRVF